MINQQAQIALELDWGPWLRRPFYAFMISIMEDSISKRAFRKIGFPGWEFIFMFDNGEYHWSEEAYYQLEPQIKAWLANHSISEVNKRLEKFYVVNKLDILRLIEKPDGDTIKKFSHLLSILKEISTYIWSAHILERYLLSELNKKAKKYIGSNIDKFIGDACFPGKKNALEEMEDKIRSGVDLKKILKEYAWMRCRDGFSRGYNLKEIKDHAETLKKYQPHQYPFIPKPLRKMVKEARELVYFRTKRTDVWYELIYLARPIIKAAAKKYNIPFSQLRYYTMPSIIEGKPIKYPKVFGCLSYKNKLYFSEKPFLTNGADIKLSQVKGSIAQSGIVRGQAKIVMKVEELYKVKKGDILVTYMTSPNFLPAMKLSAGFVTDEGGLTCHAAIVAREIKKPCVIGTKIATKIFKDGDLIEVNANKGVVRLLKR